MAGSKSLVSICVPNFNKANFIGNTIESIYNQTYTNLELFIIDDCSTDSSVEIIEGKILQAPIPVYFIRNEKNRGVCSSLNAAIKSARGKYYQMLGSDDIILPDKIEKQVTIFESLTEEYGLVFGKPYRMDTNGDYLKEDYYRSIQVEDSEIQKAGFEELLLKNFISSTSHLIRMSSLKEVGLYDESLRVEDWDLWLRLVKQFKYYYTGEYDSVYRIVPSSLTNNSQNYASVYSTYCRTLLKHVGYSKTGNRNIAKNLKSLSLKVFKYDGADSVELLKQSYILNKDVKTFILYIAAYLGIKYRAYESLKFWN